MGGPHEYMLSGNVQELCISQLGGEEVCGSPSKSNSNLAKIEGKLATGKSSGLAADRPRMAKKKGLSGRSADG